MRPSWLLVLVLVALLADSCAPSHSFNDFEKAGQTSGTAAAGRTADGLIVKFSSYAPASAHELTLDACMRTVNGSHLVIERRNPAANLPTDFLVVKFPPLDFDRLAGAIRGHPQVVGIHSQQRYTHRSTLFRDVEPDESERSEFGEPLLASGTAWQAPPVPFRSRGNFSRRQAQSSQDRGMGMKLNARLLHGRGFKGGGVRVGVMDSGLPKSHPDFSHVAERTDWTDDGNPSDTVGHGTFVAGVISGKNRECAGLAPDAEIHAFKVFNSKSHAYTAWFIDAFNFAMFRRIQILNLSVGGPDWADTPFVEKVQEASATGMVIVSAIGNDGPHWGSNTNPADQSDVVGVGGLGVGGSGLADFSSRGMTKWEIGMRQPIDGMLGGGLGYGRVKPDVTAQSERVWGPTIAGGCTKHGGTSVASPVIAGVLALLASTISEDDRWAIFNPASAKQVLIETAKKGGAKSMFEQGAGGVVSTLEPAAQLFSKYRRRATFHPATLHLAEQPCKYHWPYCAQSLYAGAIPTVVNITILNALGAHGRVARPPRWVGAANGDKVTLQFEVSETLWPWSGWLAVSLQVVPTAATFDGVVEGSIEMSIDSNDPTGKEVPYAISELSLPVTVRVMPTPPRKRRLLWDIGHSMMYPRGGYVPKDSFEQKKDFLDLNGDHPHTNYRDAFTAVLGFGYSVEILSQSFTSFDARSYGALLLIDPEEEYGDEEAEKLAADVKLRGLGLFVMADWYDEKTMEKLRILDDNTHRRISPVTGGSNVPALNDLLQTFGISLGSGVLAGDWGFDRKSTRMVNGVPIIEFPSEGRVVTAKVKDETSRRSLIAPVFGISTGDGGNVAVYGDSNCVDSAHIVSGCNWLLEYVLDLLTSSTDELRTKAKQQALARIGPEWASLSREQMQAGGAAVRDPERTVRFAQHSHFYPSSSIGKAAAATSGKSTGRRGAEDETAELDILPRFLRTLAPVQ